MGGGLLSVPMDAEVELGFQECHKPQMRQGKQNLKKKIIVSILWPSPVTATPLSHQTRGFTALKHTSVGSGI